MPSLKHMERALLAMTVVLAAGCTALPGGVDNALNNTKTAVGAGNGVTGALSDAMSQLNEALANLKASSKPSSNSSNTAPTLYRAQATQAPSYAGPDGLTWTTSSDSSGGEVKATDASGAVVEDYVTTFSGKPTPNTDGTITYSFTEQVKASKFRKLGTYTKTAVQAIPQMGGTTMPMPGSTVSVDFQPVAGDTTDKPTHQVVVNNFDQVNHIASHRMDGTLSNGATASILQESTLPDMMSMTSGFTIDATSSCTLNTVKGQTFVLKTHINASITPGSTTPPVPHGTVEIVDQGVSDLLLTMGTDGGMTGTLTDANGKSLGTVSPVAGAAMAQHAPEVMVTGTDGATTSIDLGAIFESLNSAN